MTKKQNKKTNQKQKQTKKTKTHQKKQKKQEKTKTKHSGAIWFFSISFLFFVFVLLSFVSFFVVFPRKDADLGFRSLQRKKTKGDSPNNAPASAAVIRIQKSSIRQKVDLSFSWKFKKLLVI